MQSLLVMIIKKNYTDKYKITIIDFFYYILVNEVFICKKFIVLKMTKVFVN